jgi:hypothetical protein
VKSRFSKIQNSTISIFNLKHSGCPAVCGDTGNYNRLELHNYEIRRIIHLYE